MLDPIARFIANAPVEEEEITSDLASELDRAKASRERGEGISHEKLLREFGVTRGG